MSTGVALTIAVFLLIANAFFVAVEFGLIAVQKSQLEDHLERGNRRARTALDAITNLNTQIAGAQLGITMASIGLAMVAEPSVAHILEHSILSGLPKESRHTVGLIVALTLVTFLHILLGEMVPKNMALADAPRTSMWLAPIHRAFVRVCGPLIWLLNALSNLVLRLIGIEAVDERHEAKTADELAMLLDEAHDDDVIGGYDHRLLSNTLELGEATVREAMVSWDLVDTGSTGAAVAEIEAAMHRSGHSRLVLLGDKGEPEGWVHAKDLLTVDAEAWQERLPQHRRRRLIRMQVDTLIEDALAEMQAERQHVALAVDGDSTVGIITLEDVLEILVRGLDVAEPTG